MKDRIISISFEIREERLHITVEDNGISLSEEELIKLQKTLASQPDDGEVTALININRRLKLQYDEISGVVLSRSPLGGLGVELILGPRRE